MEEKTANTIYERIRRSAKMYSLQVFELAYNDGIKISDGQMKLMEEEIRSQILLAILASNQGNPLMNELNKCFLKKKN